MGVVALFGCEKKKEDTTTTQTPTTEAPTTTETPAPVVDTRPYFYFVIYEKDSDNDNLANNKIVASYEIRYSTATNVATSLIKGAGNKYYFVEGGTDYITLKDSGYGLSYDKGYFKNYSGCANDTEIDVSWSYSAVNGTMASAGIEGTSLTDLNQYGFVIDGWR